MFPVVFLFVFDTEAQQGNFIVPQLLSSEFRVCNKIRDCFIVVYPKNRTCNGQLGPEQTSGQLGGAKQDGMPLDCSTRMLSFKGRKAQDEILYFSNQDIRNAFHAKSEKEKNWDRCRQHET